LLLETFEFYLEPSKDKPPMSTAREEQHCEGSNDKAWEIDGCKMDARAAPSIQSVDESSETPESYVLPPSGYDIDQLNQHIGLQDFGRGLQLAANAVFSGTGDRRSRYTKVGKASLYPTKLRLIHELLKFPYPR
jgi:hypothetical protein